jgi:apolipoprotein N-acyltransferase
VNSVRRSTVLLLTTIAFGVLYLAAALVLGQTPDAGDNGQTVVNWFRDHGDQVRVWAWLLTLTLPLFATFAALVRAELPSPYRDVFFFGAIALGAETAVQGWFWLGMSWHAGQLQPATARTLLDVASFWGPVLTSATVTMLAPVALLAIRGAGGLPRWLGVVAGVALIEQVIETITIFGRNGFIAPGGPMNVYLGAGLTALSLVCLGVAVSRKAARSS